MRIAHESETRQIIERFVQTHQFLSSLAFVRIARVKYFNTLKIPCPPFLKRRHNSRFGV